MQPEKIKMMGQTRKEQKPLDFKSAKGEKTGKDQVDRKKIIQVEAHGQSHAGSAGGKTVFEQGGEQEGQGKNRTGQETHRFPRGMKLPRLYPGPKHGQDKGGKQNPGGMKLHVPKQAEAHEGPGPSGGQPFERQLGKGLQKAQEKQKAPEKKVRGI